MANEALKLRQSGEQLAAALPPLLVAADRVASTIFQGIHGRRRVGQGETFWQYRHYEIGDAPQLIDWRQSAKSDNVFVRELEWEAAQTVWLWRDASPSMNWSSQSGVPDKRERADLLTLALVALLLRGGEHVSLLGSGLRPMSGRAALTRLAFALTQADEAEPGSTGNLPAPEVLPRRSQVVLIGDMLAPLQDIHDLVSSFCEREIKGHILQVLDPAEETLPYSGRVEFEGLEGEGLALISRVETVRPVYLDRLAQQRDGLADIAKAFGWTFDSHRTDQSAQSALLGLYMALSDSERH